MLSDVAALIQVILIDLALAGDNAVAVGLAAAALPEKQRKQAIFLGIVGALLLRIAFALVTVLVLLSTGGMATTVGVAYVVGLVVSQVTLPLGMFAMARHPAWGELRIGPPGGLRGLVEVLRARAWNPGLSLEEDLDRRQRIAQPDATGQDQGKRRDRERGSSRGRK